MRAAWYEKQGSPSEALLVGEMPDPHPGDVKKRRDRFGIGMPYPRLVPHSDGAGSVDEVGGGVDSRWVGKRI